MKVTTGFFLCFLICASGVNAESILCRKDRTGNGKVHYSFSNTNVNIDHYQREIESRYMSPAERAQADAIEREKRVRQSQDRAAYRQRTAEIERGREMEAYKKQMEQREIEEKKARKPKAIPVVVINK